MDSMAFKHAELMMVEQAQSARATQAQRDCAATTMQHMSAHGGIPMWGLQTIVAD